MKHPLALAVVAVAALALTSCSSPAPDSAGSKAPSKITIGNFLDISTWDPAKADIGFEAAYLSAVYDPLVQLAPDGKIIPGLATDWKVSDDLRTVTMDLRSGVTFSDGEAFDAKAAAANIEHLAAGVRAREAYSQLDTVEAVDQDTIAIHLKAPDPTMLPLMAAGRSFMAAPKELTGDSLGKTPVGSGPYTLKASTPGSEYTFERKDAHWDLKTYPFQTITIKPILDATARTNAMLAGQIDVNYGGAQDITQAKANNWNVAKETAMWAGLRFNDHTGALLKPLGDVRVRQALQMAFDAKGMLKSIGNGNGKLTNQMFAVDRPGYVASLNDAIVYDRKKAKALLSEAGYPDGFAVTMPMAPPFQPWQAASTEALGAIGVKVTWQDLSMPDYQANAASYPMAISMLALPGDAPTTVARFVSSPQWYNPHPDYTSDSELTALVDQMWQTPVDGQAKVAEKINKRLVDLAWQGVWYQSENIYISTSGITVKPIIGQMFPVLRNIQPAK